MSSNQEDSKMHDAEGEYDQTIEETAENNQGDGHEYMVEYSKVMDENEELKKENEELKNTIYTLEKKVGIPSGTMLTSKSVGISSGKKHIVPKIGGISIDQVEKIDGLKLAIAVKGKGFNVTPSELKVLKRVDTEGMQIRFKFLNLVFPGFAGTQNSKGGSLSMKKPVKEKQHKPSHSLHSSKFAIRSTTKIMRSPSTEESGPPKKKSKNKTPSPAKLKDDEVTPQDVIEGISITEKEHSGESDDLKKDSDDENEE